MRLNTNILKNRPEYSIPPTNLNNNRITAVIGRSRHVTAEQLSHWSGVEYHTWSKCICLLDILEANQPKILTASYEFIQCLKILRNL